MTFKQFDILTFGGNSVTAPIELPAGNYKVTDFLIIDESSEVLYAIPKAGSEFSKLVDRALPLSFAVRTDRVNNFPIQVVRTGESKPEKFGYVSFNIDIAAYPEFRLAVFVQEKERLNLAKASVVLINNRDTIYNKTTGANHVNDIILKADQHDTLTLIVRKDHFSSFKREFVLSELRDELQGAPLKVILKPAITFTVFQKAKEYFYQYLEIQVEGDNGKYLIADWDDGTIDTVSLSSGLLIHTYSEPVHEDVYRHVNISGDIDYIRFFGLGLDAPFFSSFNFSNLTGLQRVGIHFQTYLKEIDLSHNLELEWLAIGYCAQLQSIDLPPSKNLKFVELTDVPLDTEAADEFVGDLYQTIVTNDIHGGYLMMVMTPEEVIPGALWPFIGPPSESSFEKYAIMVQEYGWEIDAIP